MANKENIENTTGKKVTGEKKVDGQKQKSAGTRTKTARTKKKA
jgi:hypothetical protein